MIGHSKAQLALTIQIQNLDTVIKTLVSSEIALSNRLFRFLVKSYKQYLSVSLSPPLHFLFTEASQSHTRDRVTMASKKASPPPPEPMDFFPFRGEYGGSAAGAALFVAVRTAVPLLFYSLLAPSTSALSIFSTFPSLYPSRPPPADGLSVPFLPDSLLRSIERSLGLSSYSAMVFLGAALPSVTFIMYNTMWRREKFPISGQGGSIQVTT